jgi:hypothetical protein
MEKNEISTVEELSDADLDAVAAGSGSLVNLSNIGNVSLNLGIAIPIGLNIAALSNAKQININWTGISQTASA